LSEKITSETPKYKGKSDGMPKSFSDTAFGFKLTRACALVLIFFSARKASHPVNTWSRVL